jgi:hypothetical protein
MKTRTISMVAESSAIDVTDYVVEFIRRKMTVEQILEAIKVYANDR